MPYMLKPANYAQTLRPNLYNMAYRRVGAYKGMGRLHPTNYLEIGGRPNLIGGTAGQYNTLSGQLSLLPPSLRGLGAPVWSWRPRFWRHGLGQGDPFACVPGVVGTGGCPQAASGQTTDQIMAQLNASAAASIAAGATPASVGAGTSLTAADIAAINATNVANPVVGPGSGNVVLSNTTVLLIGGGLLLLVLLAGRR